MKYQEASFAALEQQPYHARLINTDAREQSSERRQWQMSPQPPRGKRPLIALLVILLLLIGAGIGFGYIYGSFTKAPDVTKTRSFHVTTHPTVVINVGSGLIHVHTGGDASVVVKETDHAAGFDVSYPSVNYNQDGNTITIEEQDNGPVLGSRSVDFDVTVPAAVDLQLHSGSGTIGIADVKGQIDAETGSGEITANNISGQQATLKTGSGEITADNMTEQSVILHTGNGSITAQSLSGEVTADTGSGSITVTQGTLDGNSVLKTGSGSITYQGSLDANSSDRFETGSGGVDLSLPASASFSLSTHTGSGGVHNDFGSDNVGGSGPQAQLSASTGSGSITIHKGA